MNPNERIPFSETYRGIGIHVFQSPHRVAVVKAAIDAILVLSGPKALLAYARDRKNPPEARLFARDKIESAWELAAEHREARPSSAIREQAGLAVASLGSLHWIDRTHYGSHLETPAGPGPGGGPSPNKVRRDRKLTEAEIEAAARAEAP